MERIELHMPRSKQPKRSFNADILKTENEFYSIAMIIIIYYIIDDNEKFYFIIPIPIYVPMTEKFLN